MQIYETTGGVFDAAGSTAPSSAQVGTATLAFAGCSTATLSYAFTGGANGVRTGMLDLVRVGPMPPGCVSTASPARL